jgi:hypothetical protein
LNDTLSNRAVPIFGAPLLESFKPSARFADRAVHIFGAPLLDILETILIGLMNF